MTWYQTGGRNLRTRISVRETKQRERERQQASEIDLGPERIWPERIWPERALGYLWGRDMIPDEVTDDLRALMDAGTENLQVKDACAEYRIDRNRLTRKLSGAGCPTPAKWLRLGQCLTAAELLHKRHWTRMRAAREVGLPASWELYKKMKRHLALTPDEVEELPSPQWRALVERWWEEWA